MPTERQAIDGVRSLLAYCGVDLNEDDMENTPNRFVKALREMTWGYTADIESLLSRTFAVDTTTDIVAVNNISFSSLCEHHLMPFTGQAQVAYVPRLDGSAIGLSKIPRLVHVYAKRLQMQERMTTQIAKSLFGAIDAEATAVRIDAEHSCMACRGVEQRGASMRTVVVVGDPERVSRIELLAALQ